MKKNDKESKRIRKFRLSIAKDIPKFPNNKEALESLQAKSLTSLLVHYTNWAIRYVAIRPRRVYIESTASSDPRWKTLKNEIASFLTKVKNGENLTPHLSLKPHTKGYTPAASKKEPNVDRWADKDYLINVMGYHHFHIGLSLEKKGFATRTDELLFAKVSRKQLELIGIFDHSVFDNPAATGKMSDERDRLWKIFDEHITKGFPPGSVIVPPIIMTSGHARDLVSLAQDYAYIIRKIDPLLDDKLYLQDMYKHAGIQLPKKPKLSWQLNFLDLGLVEADSNVFLVFKYGPN